jgi:hypothetical protein
VALPADPVKTIGGIAGTLDNASTVKNVSVRGALCFAQTGGGDGLSLGGIAGLITAGSAIQDSASGVVIQGTSTSTTSVGGVAGGNEGGSISRCYAYGNVSSMTSASAYAGGIAGYNNGAISNCAALNSEMYNYDTSLALQGRAAGFNDTGGTLANNYAYDLMKVANYPVVIPSTDRTSNSKHGADILTTTLSSSGSTTQWTGDPTQLNWPAFQPGPSAGEPAGSPWHWGKTIVIPSNANPGTGVSPAYVPALWFE